MMAQRPNNVDTAAVYEATALRVGFSIPLRASSHLVKITLCGQRDLQNPSSKTI